MDERSIVNTPAMKGSNRFGVPFEQLDPKRQASVIIDNFGGVHRGKNKVTASRTKKFRAYLAFQFIDEVNAAGFKIKNLLNLNQKHIGAAVARWKERQIAPATMQNRLSGLKWLATSLGKRGLVMAPEYYGLSLADVARTYVTEKDKSWTTNGVLPEHVIEQAMQMDEWVGMQLLMMRAFGLRVAEAIQVRPRASINGDVMVLEEGTKGGRSRIVKIRTDEQREVLARAAALSLSSRKGALVPPGKNLEQAKRRLYYVCEKLGITRERLAVTPHGLRHEYANDLYEQESGTPSVVRGASHILDNERAMQARAVVSEELNKRLSITGAYTGPSKTRANQARELARRQNPGQADGTAGNRDGAY